MDYALKSHVGPKKEHNPHCKKIYENYRVISSISFLPSMIDVISFTIYRKLPKIGNFSYYFKWEILQIMKAKYWQKKSRI